jgi:uncharacterized repeat protein (TIGR01451 family)
MIVKSDTPDPLTRGQVITYTMVVTNRVIAGSAVTAQNVVVDDPFPPATTYVSSSTTKGTCTQASDRISCRLGSMAPGESVTITLRLRTTAVGTVRNTGVVVNDIPETDTSNNTSSVTSLVRAPLQPPVVVVCGSVKVRPISLTVGKAQTVTATVKDSKRKPMRGVRVTIRGAGISVSGVTNRAGIYRKVVRASRPGIVAISVRSSNRRCLDRIGAVGAFQPPVTG